MINYSCSFYSNVLQYTPSRYTRHAPRFKCPLNRSFDCYRSSDILLKIGASKIQNKDGAVVMSLEERLVLFRICFCKINQNKIDLWSLYLTSLLTKQCGMFAVTRRVFLLPGSLSFRKTPKRMTTEEQE